MILAINTHHSSQNPSPLVLVFSGSLCVGCTLQLQDHPWKDNPWVVLQMVLDMILLHRNIMSLHLERYPQFIWKLTNNLIVIYDGIKYLYMSYLILNDCWYNF